MKNKPVRPYKELLIFLNKKIKKVKYCETIPLNESHKKR
jgi:hypothetical protein